MIPIPPVHTAWCQQACLSDPAGRQQEVWRHSRGLCHSEDPGVCTCVSHNLLQVVRIHMEPTLLLHLAEQSRT